MYVGARRVVDIETLVRENGPINGLYRVICAVSRFILNAIDNHSHLRLNGFNAQKAGKSMYVCICNAITDKQIRKAAESGVKDLWDLQRELGVAAGCGSCKEMASEILSDYRQNRRHFEPVRYQPAVA